MTKRAVSMSIHVLVAGDEKEPVELELYRTNDG